MRGLSEGIGAALACACGLALAGWLALPGYMAEGWEAPAWPEVAARASGPDTYGTPSYGTKPVLGLEEPVQVAYAPDINAQVEADLKRIEAETERSMAAERQRFTELTAAYTTPDAEAGTPAAGLQKASLSPTSDQPQPGATSLTERPNAAPTN